MIPDKSVIINYTNWKGETADRTIDPPFILCWGSTQFHMDLQWLLHATDRIKNETRTFAMKDIHSWTPTPEKGKTEK